jgi:hypothetical protein
MAVTRFLQSCIAVVTLGTSGLRADGELRVRELVTRKVGDTMYFHVRLDVPADLRMPPIEPGPSTEGRRRQLARLPRLVPQDDMTWAVYQRLDVPHFRPAVGFDARRPKPVPVKGLEFVGKVHGSGKAMLLVLYPTGEESSAPGGARDGKGLARIVRRATWAEVPLVLNFTRPERILINELEPRRSGGALDIQDLEGLWAEAQAAHLAVLEAQAPDFGFYGFACAATGRKYAVADPVLAGERAKDQEKEHRKLFELTTGTTAITQSLALRRFLDTDYRDRGQRTVDLVKVPGINIAEHDWKRMMGDKKPAPEPLARLVPQDNYYLHFKDIRKLIELGDFLDQWVTSGTRAFEGTSRDYQLKERYERQLCLRSTWMGKTLGPLVIRSVALTGSDPYLREGSDVTVLFHVTSGPAFLAAVEPFLKEARKEHGARLKESKEDYHGIRVERFVTSLREVSLHRAAFGDFVIYSNSQAGLRRVLDTHRGQRKSLWDSLDFQYMRTVFPLGDKAEDGFGFLPDAFIRQLVGPASKIKEKRRLEALTSLQMVTHGALFTAWETGKLPADHEALLAAARLKPEQIYVPDGKAITWDARRQVAVSDVYGTLHFATPLIELPIDRITAGEQTAYGAFREEYLRLWRQYFDPVGLRFALSDKQVRAEVYVLPPINNEEYNSLRQLTGGGTISLHPGMISPHALFQMTLRFDPQWLPRDRAFGNRAMLRLDDSPLLTRLAERWVRLDLQPEERSDLVIAADALTLRLPLTVGVAIGEQEQFAQLVQDIHNAASKSFGPCKITNKRHRDVPITRLKFSGSSTLVNLLNNQQLGRKLTSLTVYHAEIDGMWHISLSKDALKRQIDYVADCKAGKGPPKGEAVSVNSSVHLAPQAAVQARAALQAYLEWETHKRALPNNALWQALHRCAVLAPDAPEAVRRAAAMKFLGFVPVSPDDAPYRYDRRTGEVVNARHGSLRRPQLHAGIVKGSPLARMLEQFPTLRADLRFREDGLHTVLTIARKAGL